MMKSAQLPPLTDFHRACKLGLSVLYPFKSARFADSEGWKYGTAWPPSHRAFGRFRALLAVQYAAGLKPKRVLEVAAGGGGLGASLAARGCDVVVNDLREEIIKGALAEYEVAEKIRIIPGDMFQLKPEETGLVDLVVACEVIEHVAYPGKLLSHLSRFLEPGGRILLTTPNGSYVRNKLPTYTQISNPAQLEHVQFKPDADGHLFLLTPVELIDMAEAAGLEVEYLVVWGSPLLNGGVGLRRISCPYMIGIAYRVEQLLQCMPTFVRQKSCAALSAVLRRS
jgi:2-polyprenyl-6-hydroxyphenyl methylase/3-demethylubiquinone-9 3-methyltransferase